LERGRNTTGNLVQNLRAGFVPPEPPNPYVLVLCDRYGRLGAIACNREAGALCNWIRGLRVGTFDAGVAFELGHLSSPIAVFVSEFIPTGKHIAAASIACHREGLGA
jgi:hypothetical protein